MEDDPGLPLCDPTPELEGVHCFDGEASTGALVCGWRAWTDLRCTRADPASRVNCSWTGGGLTEAVISDCAGGMVFCDDGRTPMCEWSPFSTPEMQTAFFNDCAAEFSMNPPEFPEGSNSVDVVCERNSIDL